MKKLVNAPRGVVSEASYLGERAFGVPDAGAAAAVVWLKALSAHIK